MKKLLIYLTSTILALLTFTVVIIACGPETDPYDYFVSFFHNDVSGGKEYSNFYYTRYLRLYDQYESTSEAEINAKEWEAALNKKASSKDIQKVMYQLEPGADSLLTATLEASNIDLPDSLASNGFVKFLLKNRKNAYRDYYVFAKRIEYSNSPYDPWDPSPIDTLSRLSLLEKSLSMASKTKNKFLTLRYYYQACKSALFTGNDQQAVDIYDKFILNQAGDSHVKGWGLSLKAGALGHLGDEVSSAYYFSKVFADYPERRVSAYRDFRDKRLPIADVLARTEDNEEKAVIWAIAGLGDPDLEMNYLENVYRLAPSSEMLGVLLIREINKLEDDSHTDFLEHKELFYNNYQFFQWDDEDSLPKSGNHLAHLKKLKEFCLKLSIETTNGNAAIANVAAAYLCWMQHDTEEGWIYLRKTSEKELNGKLKDQEKLVRLLLLSQQIKDFDTINEKELLPVLSWLDKKTKEENTGYSENDYWWYFGEHRFSASARNFYQLILAPAYFSRGDTVNAALAMLKGDPFLTKEKEHGFGSPQTTGFFQNSLGLIALKQLLKIKSGSTSESNSYQSFLRNRLASTSLDWLLELTGTSCLREHQFSQAVFYLKQVPLEKRTKITNGDSYYPFPLTGNPFTDRIKDYPTMQDSVNSYDKLQYAQEMASLEGKIKKDPAHAAQYYYRMANGFYNAATYSSSWYLISYSWASADEGRRDQYSYDKDYIRAQTAERYYAKARGLSKDFEFRAKCTFMLAKCRQKQFKYPRYDYQHYKDIELQRDQYLTKNIQNPFFKELKMSYSKTHFYKVALGECSYFRDFLKAR